MRAVRLQGLYYLVGGLWPLVHWRSFTAVVGPKPDRFQTEVTAALFTAIGTALLAGSQKPPLDPAVRALAVGTALAAASVDLRHRRRIRTIFRGEAAVELAFATSAATAR